MEVFIALVGDNAMEIAGDCAYVAVDGPFVVVEDYDELFCLLGDIIEGFVGDARS